MFMHDVIFSSINIFDNKKSLKLAVGETEMYILIISLG